MQVDPTLMNVADGGVVKREICAPSETSASMVGNPPQTLPAEFRGDVTLSQQNKSAPAKDCKTMKACLESSNCNNSPDRSPAQQLSNAAASGPAVAGSEKRADKKTELPKLKSEGAGVFPTPQWSSGTKVSRDEPLKACHSNLASGKQAHPQTQTVQSVPPGFQCSAAFKPVQPVAFLPSANFPSSLCKITLPPALGDIAALRDAVASQCQKEIQPQSSGVRGAPLLRTYPYSFSVGRTPPAEKKSGASASKLKPNHSTNKNGKSAEQHKALASVVASPAIALPLQHPTLTSAAPTCYTLSPTAAICCGSALASITSQSRLLNHAEKGSSIEKTPMSSFKAPPSAAEDHKVGSAEPRDVPLDLSAKSKRPKCMNEPAVHNESNQRDITTSKRTVAYSSAGHYPVLPNTHRNGSQKPVIRPQNHQVSDSKATWGKGSAQDPIKSIPGTYVGVASPILASTLRGKDGKGTFADEFQSFAKQEFISIIDQGEHLASGGKKPSCLMKGSQHAHSNKHGKTSSLSENCPTKGAPTQIQKSGPGRAPHVNPAWQQLPNLPHQGSPNNKCTAVTEASKFAHASPSKPEDDKWDRVKSPLSNLASIVKQQAIETSEVSAQSSPLTPKDDALSQDAQPKPTSVSKCPPRWSAEKWAAAPSQADSPQTAKRQEKASHAELVKNNADSNAVPREHVGLQTKQCSSKPAGHCHLFAGNASTNGNRKESKLAQVLEGDVLKAESGPSDSPPTNKLEGMVASILAGQRAGGSDGFEKQTNGTKEESPTKAKAAAVKQRRTANRPAKEKSPMGSLKKAAARKSDTEKTPVTGCCQKEKKPNSSAPEQRRCAGHVTPQGKGSVPGDRIKMEQNHNRADEGRRQQTAETPAFHSCSAAGETDAPDSPFPRLRRGRRRADEARLDLWGFATPSPPTPPVPTPPSSPPPALNSAQPARRPRGRPRSTPLPERASRGKDRTASEAEAPAHVKRQRCRSRKYQTGEYITEKVKLEDAEHLEGADPLRQHSDTPAERQTAQCPSPKAPGSDPPPRRPSLTRSGSVRYHDGAVSPEGSDKPSGKRKFKSKHLSENSDQKTSKRGSLGKRGASVALEDDRDVKRAASPPPAPKSLPSSLTGKRGSSGRSSTAESPPKKPIPPEVRRLIVNKNAGETLLQRAARLGYQDVVLYCLEKDVREVNRRDNAGYTALHEASSRGWTQIVQMLLKHGADVNCSAQDGTRVLIAELLVLQRSLYNLDLKHFPTDPEAFITRPLHDAVASDNLPIVWLLLNHGADPTLATYSGQTPVKLAQSPTMKTFLTEYFTDLEGRKEQDPSLHWDFYSSSLFETDQEACWDFLLSDEGQEKQENDSGKTEDADKDCLVFELSSEPLLPCYHVQVSLTQGFCNWFLLTDVLKRLKMSARIFRARYPHLEVVSLLRTELWEQVSVSQVSTALASPRKKEEEEEELEEQEEQELVELVRCVPELQRLLGSSIHILQEEEEEEEEEEGGETQKKAGRARSR